MRALITEALYLGDLCIYIYISLVCAYELLGQYDVYF